MKFSENWLKEWVKLDINTNQLSDQLTMLGLEVDGVEKVAGDFSGVVVGKVLTCMQHPNADKLQVTTVDIGQNEPLQIVCGASNCRQGLFVACATIGAKLPGDFVIKKTKLRGELSEGMLCSYSELGINIEEQGIIELPNDAQIGLDVREYLDLDDHTIEISVTPNRADCLGIEGIARDVATVNNLSINQLNFDIVKPTISEKINVNLHDTKVSPRYLARIIKNINIKVKTPLWMTEKLRRCGIRSIDPVVDITNFVLLEFGHPLHAFDYEKINGSINVRYANQDEKLVLLDGNEVKLDNQTLVIADDNNALAIAGIFGGKKSGVTFDTKNILLESAFFNPVVIAGKARNYGLHTDASHRYERGVDPTLQLRAIERATQLIVSICGGQVGEVVEVVDELQIPSQKMITLRRSKLDSLIGIKIIDDKINSILKSLGCEVQVKQNEWLVKSPSWRFDIKIEEDLIEEIARIYGYNNIPNCNLIGELVAHSHKDSFSDLQRLKEMMTDMGYQEVITYSFVDPKVQDLLHPNNQSIVLPNPISSDMSAMRLSLWTGLINVMLYNKNRQQNRIRCFETGLKFIPDEAAQLGINQQNVISGLIAGSLHDEHWAITKRDVDFFDIKGDVESVLANFIDINNVAFKATNHDALHPGQSADIFLNDVQIGVFGTLHPLISKKLGIDTRVLVFELFLDKIIKNKIVTVKAISKFPANRRDLSIVLDKNINAADVIAACKKACGKYLFDINLFDLYQGDKIEVDKKSLAISLTLQDYDATLVEKEITEIVNNCIKELEQSFKATLRE